MTTPEHIRTFIQRWERTRLNEQSIAQSHFKELCAILGVPAPYENRAIPEDDYRFEKPLTKTSGKPGFADVWYRGRFVWEYKSPGKSLDDAYQQLLLYKEDLENPPVLVVCDIKRYELHIVYTGYKTRVETFTNTDLEHAAIRDLLRLVFTDPTQLLPQETVNTVTEQAAEQFAKLARLLEARGYPPEQVAPFFMKLLFALFAEDMHILPGHVVTNYIVSSIDKPTTFSKKMETVFRVMREGGYFGAIEPVPQINGWLYTDDEVIGLNEEELRLLGEATQLDWKDIEPSIFGTLFERCIDPNKRSQLGLHYTGKDDILLIVEPVMMAPLRREWEVVQQRIAAYRPRWDAIIQQLDGDLHQLHTQYNTTSSFLHIADEPTRHKTTLKREYQRLKNELEGILFHFIDRLTQLRVLDPACGSGNFLYVALHQLKNLEKEVLVYAKGLGLDEPELGVGPHQFFGIEKNPFAAELAQVVIWIGYLQWRRNNGFWELHEPVLQALQTIQCQDALLTYDDQGQDMEPEWVAADVVLGNPPFLGTKKMRFELGDTMVDRLQALYQGRVPADADLVAYWFERTRAAIAAGQVKRAGLLATQGIRGGANRKVLDRIKATGDIFLAWSDCNWILDGATVHISIVGFDDGTETKHTLNGLPVTTINADLTTGVDLTAARILSENAHISFKGITKQGPFTLDNETAQQMLQATNNPNGRPNSDVLFPWVNGLDIARYPRGMWIIDFGVAMSEAETKQYKLPFAYVKKHVKPQREKRVRTWYRDQWWLHYAPRPMMRRALAPLKRYIVTPAVSKHRLFVWLAHPVLPDCQLIVFAREDDYFFGVLHSKVHEIWTRRMGTQLREAQSGLRYTSTTTFETFPFPWVLGQEPDHTHPLVQAIAQAAQTLVQQRDGWLHQPALTAEQHSKRTLTHLYNLRPDWLTKVHDNLDQAVIAAYGWQASIADEDILAALLAINLARTGSQEQL